MPQKALDSRSHSSSSESNIEPRRPIHSSPKRSSTSKSKKAKRKLEANETNRSPMRNDEFEKSAARSAKQFSKLSDDCSDDDQNTARNIALSSSVPLDTSNIRESPARQLTPLRYNTPAPSFHPEKQKASCSRSKNRPYWLIAAICCAGVAGLWSLVLVFLFDDHPDNTFTSNPMNCSKFMELQFKFPNQDRKLFKSLCSGIKGTMNGEPPIPSIFTLFSTDDILMGKVMKEVINVTMQCINQPQDPIFLNKENLSSKLVEDYKEELMKRTVMVINDVNEVPPEAVSSLHSFCDTYNPLWPKTIIFLTMKIPRPPLGKPIEYITEYLNERWKSLSDHIRGPLITRILDQTFYIKP